MNLDDLFVFAGAGVSYGPPANLPPFTEMRDALLLQLGVGEYVDQPVSRTFRSPSGDPEVARLREVTEELYPEPFFLALQAATAPHRGAPDSTPVERWLTEVLGNAQPNLCHEVLTSLAAKGARVWTVNFDRLIERAPGPGVRTSAWPGPPDQDAQLLKPHGSLGGRLIVTSNQAVTGMSDEWKQRLFKDVEDRTAIFVGYSGRDLDFRPLWNLALRDAHEVHWFAFEAERDDVTALLPNLPTLKFHASDFNANGEPSNPSHAFAEFLDRQGLLPVDAARLGELLEARDPLTSWPRIAVDRVAAEAGMREVLGDLDGAASALHHQLRHGPDRLSSARRLVGQAADHGGGWQRRSLRAASLVIPPVPHRARRLRAGARRKWVTELARTGQHRKVLQATRRPPIDGVSTELILRSGSERFLVDLDTAASSAQRALAMATGERHAVRAAHAAFQWSMALLWSDRLDECRQVVDVELEPRAHIAANRWVGWTAFVRACLSIRDDDGWPAAKEQLRVARNCFVSERLTDGLVSVDAAELTLARRGAMSKGPFDARVAAARRRARGGTPGRFYARCHRFSLETVVLEQAEAARARDDRSTASSLYRRVAESPYPLHQALGQLGLALTAEGPAQQQQHALDARRLATSFRARLIATQADQIIRGDCDTNAAVWFC